MIVVPVIPKPRIPKVFVKRKCIENKLISVTFKVNTCIKFSECVSRYYEQRIINNELVYIGKEKVNPEISYGFQIPIELTAKEYYQLSKSGTNGIDSYVIERAKNTQQYIKWVQECIDKEDPNREYNIESFITDFPEYNQITHESEAYYPEY